MSDSNATDLYKRLVGSRIRKYRKAKGYTQEGLSQLLGFGDTSIKAIENGRTWPRIENLALIAEALDVGIEDLLGSPKKEDAKPQPPPRWSNLQHDLTKSLLRKYEAAPESISSPEIRLLLSDIVFLVGLISGLRESIRSAGLSASTYPQEAADIVDHLSTLDPKALNAIRAFLDLPTPKSNDKHKAQSF